MKSTGAIVLTLLMAWPALAGAEDRHSGGGGAPAGQAAPRSSPAPAPSHPPPAPPALDAGRGPGRGQDRLGAGNNGRVDQSSTKNGGGSTAPGRRQGDLGKTGDAVARTSSANPPDAAHGGNGHGGGVIVGVYPGVAYGGYYSGYYAGDPWIDSPPPYSAPGAGDGEGALRLKVKPVDASVYVDGGYMGIVDDFNGIFQRLRLVSGPHRVELRAPDYETLSFDILIQPDQTITYRGEMTRRP